MALFVCVLKFVCYWMLICLCMCCCSCVHICVCVHIYWHACLYIYTYFYCLFVERCGTEEKNVRREELVREEKIDCFNQIFFYFRTSMLAKVLFWFEIKCLFFGGGGSGVMMINIKIIFTLLFFFLMLYSIYGQVIKMRGFRCHLTGHWHNGSSVRQWPERPGFNPRLRPTKDLKNGTWCLLA